MDYIIHFIFENDMGFQSLVDVVQGFDLHGIIEIGDIQLFFHLRNALFRQHRCACFFVDRVMCFLFQFGDKLVDVVILIRRFFRRPGNNERRAGFVDQDTVHFIDDAEIKLTLDKIIRAEFHIVAEVVEPELVVGTIGDVGVIGFLPVFLRHVVKNGSNR